MSTSVIHPNTIQIRPSRLAGLVVGVAILTSVTTWSVSRVTDSQATIDPKPEVVSAQSASNTPPAAVTRDLVNRGLIPRESLVD